MPVTVIDLNLLQQEEIRRMIMWEPMALAPRDGTVILVAFRTGLAAETGREDLVRWEGRYAAVRWTGRYGLWEIAAPVGQGGLPDQWMVGWQPIYPTRKEPVR